MKFETDTDHNSWDYHQGLIEGVKSGQEATLMVLEKLLEGEMITEVWPQNEERFERLRTKVENLIRFHKCFGSQ